ncbi:AraC family transcriptional regulator [Cohnella abietis]|uniref:AraC family transcriptional regulator n=1 Tax=Cohnella abietis TaxID=2507935 RepID=A0A3T1D4N9_9BACL|nr:AraC family transcriptional regulator [Cohnella abietis]BBI32979.1 AraC family transcriptional regulator [Cohnella abietis]
MTYSDELWEDTLLSDKNFPINMFHNHTDQVEKEQNILFLHWHAHFEFIVMQEGRASFLIDSIPYEASPGEVLIVPSGALHVGYSLDDKPVKYVSIVFSSSLFEDFSLDSTYQTYIKPYLEGTQSFPVKLGDAATSHPEAFSLLHQAMEEFTSKKPAYRLAVINHLMLLFIHISRSIKPSSSAGHSTEQSFSRKLEPFKQLIRYLEMNPSHKISVEQASNKVNLSSFHFCKIFKKITGRTFIDFVNLLRINEAERLLRDSSMSVTEIAEQIGCDNPNYFTKLFKKYKGMTPTLSRKSLLNSSY